MAGMPYGLQAMLKDGHKHMQGVDEAVLKNIDAARGLAAIARTSLGPNGASRRRAPRSAGGNSAPSAAPRLTRPPPPPPPHFRARGRPRRAQA